MKNSEINLRDPFILIDDGKYYLYGTRGSTCWGEATGFDCYYGTDLENWTGPITIFEKSDTFWANKNYWAPEIHKYNGKYYMFASFKADNKCRGTQILISDSPEGPFNIHSDGPVTPHDWECLDGTFYISKNKKPYMVFCHEWAQIRNGTVCSIELSPDLKKAVSKPQLLFSATDGHSWIKALEDQKTDDCYVTDGPFLYRLMTNELVMIWSSFGEKGYVQAISRSDNGDIDGKWTVDQKLLFDSDGGHGMIFKGLDNKLYLTLHSPNTHLEERPKFIQIKEDILY